MGTDFCRAVVVAGCLIGCSEKSDQTIPAAQAPTRPADSALHLKSTTDSLLPVNAAPPQKEPVTPITGRFPGGERSLSPEKIDRRFKERIPRTAVELGEFIRFHGTSKRGIAYDLHLTIIDFDSTRHRIRREREYGFVEKIDGRRPYGVDGDMPDTEFGRFEITIDGKRLKIPRTAYSDLFQPRFYADFIEAFESRDGRRLYLQMSASDGAGAYTVTWAFDHERYLSREISDEC